ncbi:MAG TPA: PAS domain S-box protein [Enterovirga sp.]
MRRLYELQAKLAPETDLKVALGEIVAAAADFTGTDRGCVQLVSEDGERLEMFVHRGYEPDSGFLRHFLDQGSKPACDAARQNQQRIIIEDVASFPALLGTEDRRVALAEGICATQSTPMVSRKGELVGVLSTQFRRPHRPSEHELKLIDMLAWTAADFVNRHLTEAALRRADEARHRKTLEIDTVPVVFFNLVGGITDANDAFLDMIGYTRAELEAGQVRYEDLTPPDWAWRDEETKAELLATGKSKPFEKEYFRRDGSRIWIHCTGKMLDEHTAIEFIIDVTERKRAEQALRESKERQAFLLALSDALRPLADPVEIQGAASRVLGEHLESDRTYYCWIDSALELCTVERDYVRGDAPSVVGRYPFSAARPLLEAMGQGRPFVSSDIETTPDLPEADRSFFRGLSIRAFVCTPIIKNGELVACIAVSNVGARAWTLQEVALIGETAERTWAVVERARAEARLRESEERLRSFAETSTDTLWIVDAETDRIEYLSPAYERIWGEPRDGVTADSGHWTSRVHPDDRIKANEGFQFLKSGHRLNLEYRIVRPDGTVRYIHDAGFPIFEGGKVRRLAGVAQDLTERRIAERALAESERRARSLMEGVPQLVWRAVDGGKWTWASPQWSAFTGQPEQVSHGMGWLNTIHPDDRDAASAAWERAVETGGFDLECRIGRSDGSYVCMIPGKASARSSGLNGFSHRFTSL